MELFILRHGDAARQAQSDWERRLTGRGQEELHETLAQSREELNEVTHMFVSPYVRAQQTSQIAAQYLPASVVTQTTEWLVPEADPRKLMNFLQQYHQLPRHQSPLAAAILVSHQPLVGIFLNLLCGFEAGRYSMGTSALAAVDAEVLAAGLGHFRWLRQPGGLC